MSSLLRGEKKAQKNVAYIFSLCRLQNLKLQFFQKWHIAEYFIPNQLLFYSCWSV